MININKIIPEYQQLIGWSQHYDVSEISIPVSLTDSYSGEFFQEAHPALRLDIIQALIPENYMLEDYLQDIVKSSVNEMFNDLIQYRKLKRYGKVIIDKKTLLNRYGWRNDKIVNQDRFVGFIVKPKGATGLVTLIEEIGIQLSGAQTLPVYLYHSSKLEPIEVFDLTSTGVNWDWQTKKIELRAFEKELHNEGSFIIGYYQDDLTSEAINYSNFDWNKGECSSCRSNRHIYDDWQLINKYFHVKPIYVPFGSYTKGEMFDMNDSMFSRAESFGMNFRFSVKCDLTDFFIEEKLEFRNLLKIKVVHNILKMMKFSQQINYIEENIKMMVIRDLEGDKDTRLTNIPKKYDDELKAVSFDMSGINNVCLSCEQKGFAPKYGVVR